MSEDTWAAVDEYFSGLLVRPAPFYAEILRRSQAAGLPAIHVAPVQGAFLQLLVRATGARRVLEIGTLGAYSTTWLAHGLPEGGRLLSIEAEPRHAEVARGNLELAGVAGRVEIRLGRASEVLSRLVEEGGEPFDFAFIDADKPGYADYFGWTMRLVRPGGLIIADNVVRGGKVADPAVEDENAASIRHFNDAVAAEPRASATALQTVGAKGYDGLAVILVNR